MALPADYITGTITLTNGSVDFTGTDTGWLAADFREGDTIPYVAGGESFAPPIIATITSNTAGTLTTPWAGPTLTGVAYRMRYQWDSSRVSAQTRTMIEQLGNGNLQSISALTGPGVLVFDGPHSTVVRPETDFINGVAYDVQVDTLADRAAYDGQAAGFAVLVSDVGDGRSAVYSKNSNTVGDWSDPAYITGPVGPLPVIGIGTTTTLPPGSDATVSTTPVSGGVNLNFGIPEGEGFNWAGVYNIANAYVQDDVVRHNGSAFIAVQSVPAGNSPSSVFPPVDTAYWAVLAAKGQDGTGTGDVVGPASSLNGGFARFSGTTGKLLIGTDVQISDADIVDSPTSTIKGRIATGNGPATNLTPAQVLTLLNAYARTNILGTVSQSGGVPTGALIERGSNANGRYVRFADGTQICWLQQTIFLDSALYQNAVLPIAFVDTLYSVSRSFASNASSGATGTWNIWKSLISYDNLNTTTIGGLYSNTSQPVSGVCYVVVSGRWF